MRYRPLTIAAGALAAMAAGIAITHHAITGTWEMTWSDLLFWQRNSSYGDGIVSRSWEFEMMPGGTISVEATDADVQVMRGERNRVAVEIWLAGETADVDNYKTSARLTDPATLRVVAKGAEEWSPNGGGRARILLFVPERSNITINALRGGAIVGDIQGRTAIRTAGGDIALLAGEGPMALGATEGKVVVERHRGGGAITATRGSVQTSYLEGTLTVSALGAIDIRSHLGTVRATSVEGAVSAELLRPDSVCTLASREGDVRLKILPNATVDLDALSTFGMIATMLRTDTSSAERPTYGRFIESFNGGGIPIILRTERGNIELSEYGD